MIGRSSELNRAAFEAQARELAEERRLHALGIYSKDPKDHPIVKGDLKYFWVTNADPKGVTVEGSKVVYDLSKTASYLAGAKPREFENAVIGKPSLTSQAGACGIYVLKEPS